MMIIGGHARQGGQPCSRVGWAKARTPCAVPARAVPLTQPAKRTGIGHKNRLRFCSCNSALGQRTGVGQGQPCGPGGRRVRSYLNSGCARIRAATPASGQQQTWPPTRANRTQVDQCAAPVASCRTSAMNLATSSAIFGPWRRATRRSAGSPLARRSPTSSSRALSSRFQASRITSWA